MSDINYEYDEVDERWLIKLKNHTLTAEQFIQYIIGFFGTHEIDDLPENLFGKNFANIYDAQYQIVTSKNKEDKIIKTPAMLQSWIRIILDYAQSSVYVRTNRKLLNDGLSVKDADKQAMNMVREFSKFLIEKPNYFGN